DASNFPARAELRRAHRCRAARQFKLMRRSVAPSCHRAAVLGFNPAFRRGLRLMDNRLGVDIGGTFTDVALEHGGRRYTAKVLTTSTAPERGVLAAIRAVLEAARLSPAALSLIIHGTTLSTNAL